jgi:hypothetical protein
MSLISRKRRAAKSDEELLAVEVRSDRHRASEQPNERVAFRFDLTVWRAEHLDAGGDQN